MDLDRIVSELKSERDRISRAISLLENESTKIVRKTAATAASSKMAGSKKRSGELTPAGRKRLYYIGQKWSDIAA